jgi:hypothetical protein
MTHPAEFDRIARAWLAEGPAELSDRVLGAALQEVHVTTQRRVLRAPWRTLQMPNPLRLAAYAGVAAAIAIAAFVAISPRTPTDPIGGSPSPVIPSPTPSLAPSAAAAVELPVTGRVDAGTYRTDWIDPPLTFTWETGLDIHHANPGIIVTAEAARARYLIIANAVAVYEPVTDDPSGRTMRQELPEDLVAWLLAHPGLDVGPAEPVTIGGLEGQAIEGLPSDAAVYDEGALNLFGVSDETEDTLPILADQAFRIAVLEGPSGPVIVAITPRADLYEDFLPTALAILETIDFED